MCFGVVGARAEEGEKESGSVKRRSWLGVWLEGWDDERDWGGGSERGRKILRFKLEKKGARKISVALENRKSGGRACCGETREESRPG